MISQQYFVMHKQKIVIIIIMELSAYATKKQESNATCIYYEIYRKIYSKQL